MATTDLLGKTGDGAPLTLLPLVVGLSNLAGAGFLSWGGDGLTVRGWEAPESWAHTGTHVAIM